MPKFGPISEERLLTCHPDIIRVMRMAIQYGPDFSIICGHRSAGAQLKAFDDGNSLATWPNSKHNAIPSSAVDIAPYPIDWENWNRFRVLAGYIMGVGDTMGIHLRWGGDWNKNYDEGDEKFRDLPHFELVEI
jgi:peptidoglycan LD-endopeptidase CwlK